MMIAVELVGLKTLSRDTTPPERLIESHDSPNVLLQ
jgi:hypothetical protein